MPVRVGLIGAGFAARAHVDALRRLPGVETVGLASSGRARSRSAAEALGLPRWYDNWQQLLSDDSIDAVHNCAPNALHAEVNAGVLRAGKHLLSEKPLSVRATESAALVEVANTADVIAAVSFNYRYFPLVRHARELVTGQTIGTAHFMHGSYLQDWLLYDTDWNWRIDPINGGPSRAVADIGSHWIDLAQYVSGDSVSAVCSDLSTLHALRHRPVTERQTFAGGDEPGKTEPFPVSTEDFGTVMLRFESGARGSLVISQASAGRKNRLVFEIDASRAAVAWNQELPNELWIGRRERPSESVTRDPSLLSPTAGRFMHLPAGHPEGWSDALVGLFSDFYSAVAAHQRGESYDGSFATLADAHRLVEITDAIVVSARNNRWEAIPALTKTRKSKVAN